MVKPSSPETRGKGPSLMGNCVSRVAEILEVTPSLFNSIHPYIPSSSGFTNSLLNPPVHILCPSTPMSPDSSSQSLAPMENRVNSKFFSKKVNDEGQIPVDIPNLEMETEVIQPACPYQMSESVNSLSANLRSPCKESSKATVHLGGIAGSPSGEFQIEGLSPRKMAKVREVLKTLDIKVFSQSNLSFWPYPNILSRLQFFLPSLSGMLKSLLKSSPLSGWWLTRSRSPLPSFLFDDRVVAQIISISKDGLGFPKEHL
ncbi:hypothetical protein CK203_039841 [Vitis vinifera]|uniref:Uncharacterized protein n=1 Tax=Vitis vinifera TaxID=29760 RepID=A0A438HQF9_VITVI|nr:hypothetical protein CK203_039841 [Vitis vinifera]